MVPRPTWTPLATTGEVSMTPSVWNDQSSRSFEAFPEPIVVSDGFAPVRWMLKLIVGQSTLLRLAVAGRGPGCEESQRDGQTDRVR